MKSKPLKPLVHGGSFLPTGSYTPLVYSGGKTTGEDRTHKAEACTGEGKSKC